MEVIKETSSRSRFALFICSVDSRLPVKRMKRFLKKKKLRKRIRNYVSENVPKSSKVYQVSQAPFLRKSVVFANGERIREINKFRMTKKYPLRSSCKMLSLENKMVYKSLSLKRGIQREYYIRYKRYYVSQIMR